MVWAVILRYDAFSRYPIQNRRHMTHYTHNMTQKSEQLSKISDEISSGRGVLHICPSAATGV